MSHSTHTALKTGRLRLARPRVYTTRDAATTHTRDTTQSHSPTDRQRETFLSLGETIYTREIHARLVVAVVLVAMLLVCACTAGIASSDASLSAQGHAHAHVVRPSCQSTQLPPLSIFSTSSAMSSAW